MFSCLACERMFSHQKIVMNHQNPFDYSESLGRHSAATSRWDSPEKEQTLQKQANARMLQQLIAPSADTISDRKPRWLYPNWCEVGSVTVIVGEPGAGKTTLVASLAAGITAGPYFSPHPKLSPVGRGDVLWIGPEDDPSIVTSRLEAAGAALSRVHFINEVVERGVSTKFNIFLPAHQQFIEAKDQALGNKVALIVLDPIYANADFDPNNNHRARQAYESLQALARRLQCGIIGIAHAVKNVRGKSPLQRIGGPPALSQVPREIILLSQVQNPLNESGATHIMLHAKNNDGEINGGFAYRLVMKNHVPVVEIVESIAGTPTEILAFAETIKVPGRRTKQEIAEEFIRETLCHGPRLRTEIDEMVKAQPFSKNTLELAKNKLKVVTKKRMGDGRYVWSLPSSTSP